MKAMLKKRLPEFKGLVAFPFFIEIGLVFSVPEYKIERNECISSEMSKRKGTRSIRHPCSSRGCHSRDTSLYLLYKGSLPSLVRVPFLLRTRDSRDLNPHSLINQSVSGFAVVF